jgi:carbamoyltransferase
MMLVVPVQPAKRRAVEPGGEALFGIDRLKHPRSVIPAVTHVDGSARIQTVHRETNPRYHELIQRFAARTGCPVLVNTSFNVRGEPIVCSPADAYRCFMRTQIDALVLENFLLLKETQPPCQEAGEWRRELEFD